MNQTEVRSPARGVPRKEVIQPQVPLRLPCYDFTPVAELTVAGCPLLPGRRGDRKSTRLNSRQGNTSQAVFCLKEKTTRSEEQAPELQSRTSIVCRLLLHRLADL